jgi:DNA mismatch repair protein MutL
MKKMTGPKDVTVRDGAYLVHAGRTMSGDEQRELVRLLEANDHPRTCPHGRPTIIHVSSDALARQFRRR